MQENEDTHLLSCNNPNHPNFLIQTICRQNGCGNQSAFCQKCQPQFHSNCDFIYFEDLPNIIKNLQNYFKMQSNILEPLIMKLHEIQKQYSSNLQIIDEYISSSNMTNLNKIGMLLRTDQRIDETSIQTVNQQIKSLIETNLSQSNELSQRMTNQSNQEKKSMDLFNELVVEQHEKKKSTKVRIISETNSIISHNQGQKVEAIEVKQKPQSNITNIRPIKITEEELYNKGVALIEQNKFQEAIYYFDNLLKIYPNDQYVLHNKGLCLRKLNKLSEAVQVFDILLKCHPKNGDAYHAKGLILDEQHKYMEAIKCYDQALLLNPKDIRVLQNKGHTLYKQDKFVDAMKYYEEILDIDPSNDKVWQDKVACLYKQRRFKEAIVCFDISIDIKPTFQKYFDQSLLLQEVNQLEVAETCLKKALELDPNHSSAKERLKWIQIQLKK